MNSILITVVKAFRIIRIFKLARFWKRFSILLDTLKLTAMRTVSFALLLFFLVFAFTLLGQEFFSKRAKFNALTNELDFEKGVVPVFNFDNFTNALVSVFMILVNDG